MFVDYYALAFPARSFALNEHRFQYRVTPVKKLISLFKICSISLLVLLILIGWSHLPLLLHLEAEKDDPYHNPQTCPQCQQLHSIASALSKSNIGANPVVLTDAGRPILCTVQVLKSHWKTYTISRAPPVV
jgi:hypothetical protein